MKVTDQVPWVPDNELESPLASLLDEVAEAKAPKLTKAQRMALQTNAIQQKDIEHLFALGAKMADLVHTISANGNLQPEDLTEEKLSEVLNEYLNLKDLKDVYDVRYQMIRTLIFAAITEKLASNNVADPEHAPGELPIPARGKRFVRQGGKRKVTLDKTALRDKLGPKRWERVCKAVVVPAVPEHVEESFNQDGLFDLVAEDPAVMELIRECAVVTGRTPSSFHVKELTK